MPQIELGSGTADIPTRHGTFKIASAIIDGITHAVAWMGELSGQDDVLVRVHSECLTGDVFGSLKCDCGEQREIAMQMIGAAGRGALIYMRGHEGRGIGLANKILAYQLQEQGLDTIDANLALGLPDDDRKYAAAADILEWLGVRSIELLTNNPDKVLDLVANGVVVKNVIPINTEPTTENIAYLRTKRDRSGHNLLY